MKILQLCNKPPFPPVDGGCVAMNALTSGLLANGNTVKVLAISTQKHPLQNDKIPAEYLKNTGIETVFIDTSLKVSAAIKNLFSSGSYNVQRFISKEFEQKIIETLRAENYDCVLFESLFVAPYLEVVKKNSSAKTILRAHNVEHVIWQRLAKQTNNILKKQYLGFLAKRLKKYELEMINRFNGIAAMTYVDKNYFLDNGCTIPVDVFPLGIDSAQYKPAKQEEEEFPSLFHLGSMDWQPNEEGIKWFLEKVWLRIYEKFPELKLYLAGRNMPEWLATLEIPNVVIAGEVQNAHEFMRQKAIMVVPLLSGGGMRVKIIEGMALGKAIISTTIGAEGIEYTTGENILIADTPEQFVEQIEKLLNDKNLYYKISLHSREHVLKQYDYKVVTKELVSFIAL